MSTSEKNDVKPNTAGPIGQEIASALPSASQFPEIHIPQEAAIGVVKGSVGLSALMGTGGMIYGALRAQPAILYGMQFGINTFSFAFPIFAVRQYIAIPWYNEFLRQRFGDGHIPSIHSHNLIPTTASGALMGGAMSAYFSGRQKFWPGVRTFAAISLAFQIASNEVSFLRIKLLADSNYDTALPSVQTDATLNKSATKPDSTAPNTSNQSLSSSSLSAKTDSVQREISLRPANEGNGKQKTGFMDSVWEKVASWSPVHRISDEDYEKSLERQREEIAEKLKIIDQRIVEEESATRKV